MEHRHTYMVALWLVIYWLANRTAVVCQQLLSGGPGTLQVLKASLLGQVSGGHWGKLTSSAVNQNNKNVFFGCTIFWLKPFTVNGLGPIGFVPEFLAFLKTSILLKPIGTAILTIYAIGVVQLKQMSRTVSFFAPNAMWQRLLAGSKFLKMIHPKVLYHLCLVFLNQFFQ